MDPGYSEITYQVNASKNFGVVAEIGGLTVAIWFVCHYVCRSFIHPFYYKVSLMKDLLRVDPKVRRQKVKTYGVSSSDFKNDDQLADGGSGGQAAPPREEGTPQASKRGGSRSVMAMSRGDQ